MSYSPLTAPSASRLVSEFQRYWEKAKGRHAIPARADLDPADLHHLLPHMIMVDIEEDPQRVRYRMVGQEIQRVSGQDFSGRYLDELTFSPPADSGYFLAGYSKVIESQQPHAALVPLRLDQSTVAHYESAIFPLSSNGRRINRCIAVEDYMGIDWARLGTVVGSA
ncbi:PAS domain-containing protein [Rhodovibrionaceae bacterium A322]